MAPPICQPLPFPRGQPATPYQQAVQLPGKSSGLGVTFDSPTTKPAPTGGQDADAHGRQGTRGPIDNGQPARHSEGVQERSSVRTTSKPMPHQVGECPTGAPCNVPPALTPESTPPQCNGGMRDPPKDPLKNVANYRRSGWRKDLEHVLRAYYKYNFTSFKEVEWFKIIRDKFFKHLLQCQDKWKSIKEDNPLQYMSYMKKHFCATTSIKMKGLSDFMGWIKCGSYYHAVVARKGQLHKCPHLMGVELPRWPQVTPSESCLVSQRIGRPLQPAPVHRAKWLAWLKGPVRRTHSHGEVEWGMAGPGWTEPRPVLMTSSGEIGLRSIAGQHQGDGKASQHFPSRSKITMGDVHPYSSSTNMQESNHGPATKCLPWG